MFFRFEHYDRTVMRVVQCQLNGFRLRAGFHSCDFALNPDGAPLPVVSVLKWVQRINLLLVNIGDVRLVPGCGPADPIIETVEKKWAAEPADATGVKFAGHDEMGFVILETVRPGHMGVLDVDDATIG